MGEFEEKINGILSSPKDMEKIMNLARSIGGSGEESKEEIPRDEANHEERNHEQSPQKDVAEDESPLDLSGLLGSIDPAMLKTVGALIGGKGDDGGTGKSAALLGTITPFLKDERKEQVKRAMTIAKFAQVAKLAFSDELQGGDKHV